MRRLVLAAAVLCGLACGPALAAPEIGPAAGPLPGYDTEQYCEMTAARSGKPWMRHVCIKKEASAKEDSLPLWRTMNARVRETCEHYAGNDGGSFWILNACLAHFSAESKGRLDSRSAGKP